MIPLSTAVSGGITFTTISRGFEVQRNGRPIGTLQRPSLWSASYVASTPEGSWIFRRGGFFNSGSEIVDSVSQQIIAKLKCSWGGKAELTFTNGLTFAITFRGFWHPVWSVTTSDGLPVLQVHMCERSVEIQTHSIPDSQLALLAMFTLYRKRQMDEDAAVAVMAAS